MPHGDGRCPPFLSECPPTPSHLYHTSAAARLLFLTAVAVPSCCLPASSPPQNLELLLELMEMLLSAARAMVRSWKLGKWLEEHVLKMVVVGYKALVYLPNGVGGIVPHVDYEPYIVRVVLSLVLREAPQGQPPHYGPQQPTGPFLYHPYGGGDLGVGDVTYARTDGSLSVMTAEAGRGPWALGPHSSINWASIDTAQLIADIGGGSSAIVEDRTILSLWRGVRLEMPETQEELLLTPDDAVFGLDVKTRRAAAAKTKTNNGGCGGDEGGGWLRCST